jgi:hypothetical protein
VSCMYILQLVAGMTDRHRFRLTEKRGKRTMQGICTLHQTLLLACLLDVSHVFNNMTQSFESAESSTTTCLPTSMPTSSAPTLVTTADPAGYNCTLHLPSVPGLCGQPYCIQQDNQASICSYQPISRCPQQQHSVT